MSLKSITVLLLGLAGAAAGSVADDKPTPAPAPAAQGQVEVKVETGAKADGPAISVHTGPGGPSVVVETPSMPELPAPSEAATPAEPAPPAVPAPIVEVPGVTVRAGLGGTSVVVETPILAKVVPTIRAIRPRVVVVPVSTGDRVERLVDRLQHGTPVLSQRAARVLILLGDPRAVEPLIQVLGDENPEVRQLAADVLRSITGQNFGQDQGRWQAWYQGSLQQAVPQQ